MNPISQRETTVCAAIAQRLFNLLRLENPPSDIYEGSTVVDVLMDLEYVNDVCRLDFDKLLAFDDSDFLHDLRGIYLHFNRETKKLENCFDPRCSKPVAQTVGATSGETFDKARATNLYLMAVRDLGIDLGGFSLIDLLMDRTDWQYQKCREMSEYVLSDDAIKRLLVAEDIPKVIDQDDTSRQERADESEFVDSHDIAIARGASQNDLDKENL